MLANADRALLLWINGLAGKLPLLDMLMQWIASDYLIPVSLGLTLVALWFVGRDAPTRQKYQIGVFAALKHTTYLRALAHNLNHWLTSTKHAGKRR